MIKKPEHARKALNDVDDPFLFWLCDGTYLKNLYDLKDSLEFMSDEVFTYHVNKEKNDFSKWIEDIIQDKRLANGLRKARTKEQAKKIVSKRIKWLEEKAGMNKNSSLKKF